MREAQGTYGELEVYGELWRSMQISPGTMEYYTEVARHLTVLKTARPLYGLYESMTLCPDLSG